MTNPPDSKQPAVYYIQNRQNGKGFVGYSKQPAVRWRQHKGMALGGPKDGPRLPVQHAMAKYGIESFDFTILANANPNQLADLARDWGDKLNTDLNRTL